ncbi:hypothetical protein [Nocardioides dilutus]
MTAVLVAVFSALGGVLAGLVPTIAVSERRRLLRFIRDEAATLKELDGDEDAAAHVRQALGASTSRYRSLAVQTRWSKAVRQFELVRGPSAFFVAIGLTATVVSLFVEDDTWSVALLAVGVPMGLLGGGLFLGMALRVAAAAREEGAIQDALDAERERREAAEASIDEVGATLQTWESTYGEDETPEVQDLLAALQRSVDAAKDSRSKEVPRHRFYGGGPSFDVDPHQMRLLAAEEEEDLRRRSEEVGEQPPLI